MSEARDMALLRRFEPVARYTWGEQFFPMDVEPFVRASSLWVQPAGRAPRLVIPANELTLERLGEPRPSRFGDVTYLKLTDPLSAGEMAAETLRGAREARERFRAGRGRLARVGYFSRFIDALFSLSLFVRGRVPGDAAAAARRRYAAIQAEGTPYSYHGRVHRQDGWIVLQYWFFYLFNNWRSGFFGANDHEGDWEMIAIYLSEPDSGEPQPEWVAYASHDYEGDDLRRRWDDPELRRVGEHPVIFVGAGSHASYFRRGEYLTEVELPFLVPLIRWSERVKEFWRRRIRIFSPQLGEILAPSDSNLFRIPFVDYARGDGLSIGPGQRAEWAPPRVISAPPAWVSQYRGLWGLYIRDPFAGEDAPAGPMYRRDGSVRRAWYDPIGWAGLDKVPPGPRAIEVIARQRAELEAEREQLEAELAGIDTRLRGLGVRIAAVRGQPHLLELHERLRADLAQLTAEGDRMRARLAEIGALRHALGRYRERLEAGHRAPPREHLRRAHEPATPTTLRLGRLAETWAATSVTLMLFGVVALLIWAQGSLVFGLVASLALFVSIEAGFRGRLISLVTSVTGLLAGAAALVLVFEFAWELAILSVIATGLYILVENLRELWS